jgi:hypothetical protein
LLVTSDAVSVAIGIIITLQTGADAVVVLCVVFQSAQEKRSPQQKQAVGDNRAGDRRLDEHVLSGAQRRQRDDQFGQFAKRRVEQPADRIAGLGRHRLGGVAQQRRERGDRQDGQDEQQRVRLARPRQV